MADLYEATEGIGSATPAKPDSFYMLYAEDASAPSHKHFSLKDAYEEAARLVAKTQERVFLLRAEGVFGPVKPTVTFRTL